MKDKHITEIIDSVSLASLSQGELDEVLVHTRDCASCRAAYEAAQLSASIIKKRAQVTFEPPPFFQTRVLAALREQQSASAIWGLWKSARALVSSMAVVTVALAVLSFVVPVPVPATSGLEQTAAAYSAESVIFDQGEEQMSYEQVLNTIYADEDEAK
jgi:anti-sigma-K factor RskA